MRAKNNYETMTIQELAEIAREKGVKVSNQWTVVRGVTHDRVAEEAHGKLVGILNSIEDKKAKKQSNMIGIISLCVAIAGIVITVVITR